MSNPRQATIDLATALRNVFRNHTKNNREKAWNSITSSAGHKEIDKLIINPNRPLNGFNSLSFKEWLKR